MEQAVEAFAVVLIVASGIFTFRGLGSRVFLERHLFHVRRILDDRQYLRLVTSGFLHANIAHFAFNMFALYSFSQGVGTVMGILDFVALYFGSLVAGNLLALYVHRDHPDYRALGASGAVSGVIFASILMFPDGRIGFLLMPMGMPSWLFGILFILISIYGIRSQAGMIGHEAHLGGAIAGVLISAALVPRLIALRPLLLAALLVPAAVYLYLLAQHPRLVRAGTAYRGAGGDRPNGAGGAARRTMRGELDGLLDKMNREGIDGLSRRERARLHDLSRRLREP
ncbi:MAG: rhomboid family intramembrane serine protease [Candidatus Krumholzibacteria bacterium]|nr:rhomboid family intramembrane serine protease [Candidatus Krumholzibacteria bacterium]